MRLRDKALLAVAWLAMTAGSVRADGRLDQIRSEVRDTSPGAAPASGNRDPDDDDYARNRRVSATTFSEASRSFFVTLGWYGLTSPFWGPRVLLEGDTAGVDAWFNETSYENTAGSMTFADETGLAKVWFTRFQLEHGNNFDDVNHWRLRFQSDVFGRFGVDTETFFLNESVPGRPRDHLQTGDVNLVYRFAHNECWQFRSGLGYNWLHDGAGMEHGVNFTYSADLYPFEPVFASASIDLGSLGDTSRTHGRTIIGVTRHGWGVYTGYDGLRIGDAKIHSWVNGIEFRY